jgi:hypothetical protein
MKFQPKNQITFELDQSKRKYYRQVISTKFVIILSEKNYLFKFKSQLLIMLFDIILIQHLFNNGKKFESEKIQNGFLKNRLTQLLWLHCPTLPAVKLGVGHLREFQVFKDKMDSMPHFLKDLCQSRHLHG